MPKKAWEISQAFFMFIKRVSGEIGKRERFKISYLKKFASSSLALRTNLELRVIIVVIVAERSNALGCDPRVRGFESRQSPL